MYAVVRLDRGPFNAARIEYTIKEVLPTSGEADREAERLNTLLTYPDQSFYFVQPARFYPNGRRLSHPPSSSQQRTESPDEG